MLIHAKIRHYLKANCVTLSIKLLEQLSNQPSIRCIVLCIKLQNFTLDFSADVVSTHF